VAVDRRSWSKRILGSSRGQAIIGYLIAHYIRLVIRTTRWQVSNGRIIPDTLAQGRGVITITWHSSLMMIPAGWTGRKPLHLLVSRHGDGELVARTLAHFGMIMVRGSTHRQDRDRDKGGAAALRQMLTLLKAGHTIGLTPDGPRGPARQLSAGVITLARLSGAPIIPVTICTARFRLFRSWDSFRFALPFSRGAMIFGEPINIQRKLDDQGQEAARLQVEAALDRVTEQADQLAGAAP
jgi:lysophospholipid acyltransferase (LPLAT)-like uncharacterized protein